MRRARLNLDLVLATDRCHVLENPWGDDAVAVRFEDPQRAMDALVARGPFDGVAAVGDAPSVVAAQAAARLGLRFSPPDAVLAAKNKSLAHQRFRDAGLHVAASRLLLADADATKEAHATRYPCVLKPVSLSASRGVIRADDPTQFAAAFARIRKILEQETEKSIQVEDFIPGREFALEGLVTGGNLQTLALFDKPDPLDGPFFEETIYLTPSRAAEAVQRAIIDAAQQAVRALGLTYGPVHAEMRVNDRGVWMLEAAARPIGGLCGRVLRFEGGATLEEVILRHALGEDVSHYRLAPGAHGVMMIPIPRAGVFAGVEGDGCRASRYRNRRRHHHRQRGTDADSAARRRKLSGLHVRPRRHARDWSSDALRSRARVLAFSNNHVPSRRKIRQCERLYSRNRIRRPDHRSLSGLSGSQSYLR